MKHSFFSTTIFLATCLPCTLPAQDLHIFLDARNDKTDNLVYVLDGDTLKQPRVRHGNHIFLHVLNFNNYLYKLNFSAGREEIRYTGGSPLDFAGLPGVGENSGGMFPDGVTGLSPFSGFSTTGLKNALKMDGNIKGYAYSENLRRIETSLAEMKAIESRVRDIDREVEGILQMPVLLDLALADIETVKRQPDWSPAEIQNQARKYMKQVFQTETPGDIDAERMLRISRLNAVLYQKRSDLQEVKQTFDRQLHQLSGEASVLEGIRMKDEKLREVESALSGFLKEIPVIATELGAHLEKLDSLAEHADDLDIQTLTRLRRNLEGILKNSFSHSYRILAEGDLTHLTVSFALRDSAESENNQVLLAYIKAPVYGGFKVNASIGMGFGRYFHPAQRYFMQDSVVRAEAGDHFSPIITSLFHFYWQKAGNLSFGGSFGIGLPLVNSGESQSATFFLGPSLFLGKRERLVLTAGIMGGRTPRLANNLKTGDVLELGDGALPTHHPYELGYFLGLSFNLFAEE